MDVQKTRSSGLVWRIVSASIIGTLAGGAALAQQKAMPEETVFSSTLRFQGDVVEVLPSGQAIRKTAIVRGRTFEWVGKLDNRVATEESPYGRSGPEFDEDSLSVEELAEHLRGRALFNGHEFMEAAPAYDLARAVKEYRELERQGASQDLLDKLLPAVVPSQGSARPTLDLEATEGGNARGPGREIRSVHGPADDRRVMSNTSYPHRTHIVFDNVGSTTTINGSQGSGTLIGPSTAMSVAHVFWDEANNTWEADFLWAPGFDSADWDSSPYGDWYRCYWVTIPGGYVAFESASYDYAVLDFNVGCNWWDNGVNSDRPGSTVGWIGTYTASESSIQSRTGYVRGYPALGTCGNPGQTCGVRVWGDHSWSSENDATSSTIRHQADTSGGQSGSAFYHYADPSCSGCGYGAYLVGMHRAGSTNYNLARRYTSSVYNFMKAYSDDY